jgi:hypothetical protein
MTLKTIDDPVPWVLAHPERYFKAGKPNDLELAQSVWIDATLSGCREVMVHHDGAVWAIAGSANWLREKTLSAPDLFVRVVPLAAAGPNSMRSEILLNAFCTEVVALVGSAVVFDKSASTVRPVLEDLLRRWTGLEAGIAFRL